MIDETLWTVYTSDMMTILIAIPVLVLVWAAVGAAFFRKIRFLSGVLAVVSAAVILYATVLSRSESSLGADLIPFSSFERAKVNPEMYRSMLMNVFLFVPAGLSLPFVFGGDTAKRMLLTLLAGFLLSAGIEAVQYFFSLGMTEADDVICNTLGAAIGACAYPLALLFRRLPPLSKR